MFRDGSMVGQICHIHAQRRLGPRADPALQGAALHQLSNLILLCRDHHKIVDDQPEIYTADALREIKRIHEEQASTTPIDELVKVLRTMSPAVPSAWEDRPGAPKFRLSLGSTRRDTWAFNVDVSQISGSVIGTLKARFFHGDERLEWHEPRMRNERQWVVDELKLVPDGRRLGLEFRFWWDGEDRIVSYEWEKESYFQGSEVGTSYGNAET